MDDENVKATTKEISFEDFKGEVLADYKIANESRETSLLGRREVLTGKAKFGIFGDGKEIAQIALAKQFKNGDFRSGYYRDQTWMMAADILTIEQFFAQLYANPDVDAEPFSVGRQMNCHFATRSLEEDGSWKNLMEMKNTSADISPTAGQMARLLGLAYASKFYRNSPELQDMNEFSKKGNEVAFGSIGDASTSEGVFWETINAAGVLQVPLVMSVWDDGHGISVPKKYQTTKESISEILAGFQRDENDKGIEILKTKGWDYAHLCSTYERAAKIARQEHVPVLVHVEEVTQPQGHSTSGSHERYKSDERLQWEKEFDPISKMKQWIIESAIASEEELNAIEKEAKQDVKAAKTAAWKAFLNPIKEEVTGLSDILNNLATESNQGEAILALLNDMSTAMDPERRLIIVTAKKALRQVRFEDSAIRQELLDWIKGFEADAREKYNTHLYSETFDSALNLDTVEAEYADETKLVDGRELLKLNFDRILGKHKEVVIFGEDSGKIGGVNQGLESLQEKYGEHRVFDTGIRESTIIGQGIGLALRGLRPIAEIQYLDYLLYGLQTLSDDLATLRYRTKGGQKAPLIVRTRGHRLEGIWHSGSPLGMIINSLRGIYICVPRNMTQAVGFYNTLIESDDPAIVIESLNGYRLKEKLITNLDDFKIALGEPEIIVEGQDVTIVTYGSMVRMAEQAAKQLAELDISVEIIDVQTLLPFDINHTIVESLKKTNKIIFVDEDVPGGATAFMLQKVLEEQGGYYHLDTAPKTIAAQEHRTAYGSDGDYFSKSSIEDMVEGAYELMHDNDPDNYPSLY